MSSDGGADLRAKFDGAFIYPIATHSWMSKRGRSHWVDLEVRADALAGPLYSVVERGGCAYVYTRDDEYFAGVHDPDGLRARLLQWRDKLHAGLDRFVPGSTE